MNEKYINFFSPYLTGEYANFGDIFIYGRIYIKGDGQSKIELINLWLLVMEKADCRLAERRFF